MKKIIFNELKIKNFLSVGEKEIFIKFQTGINLITGDNKDKDSRNGVGKSSIIESIYWCLFGNTLRDIKKDKIIHNQSNKNCSVGLNFTVTQGDECKQYQLIRSLEPNKVSLYENGQDISMSSMPKTDSYIKELIGGTEEVFQNAVVMSANNTIPFMAQKKVDKRKFIEGILQLNIFSEMLLKTRNDFNEIKNENTKLSTRFTEQQRNLEIYQKQIKKNEEIKQSKVELQKKKINDTENKIKEISEIDYKDLENQLKEIKNTLSKKEKNLQNIQTEIIPKLNDKLKQQHQRINEIISKIANLEQTQIKITSQEGACSLCKRPFDNTQKYCNPYQLKEIEEELQKFKNDLHTEKSKLTDLTNKEKEVLILQTQLNKDVKILQTQIETLTINSKSLEQLEIRFKELNEELKNLLEEQDPVKELLESVEIEIKKIEESLQQIQKQMTILDTVKFVVSEEGVKTFIIKKMLGVLNNRLNHYLQALEAPCVCNFNEMFEETIINDKGKESSYFNFSGGEKKRIDLAVLFMFQDILRDQTGSTFSLSMYDELFDSALDAKGVNKILEILRERTENYQECVYIVSHNKETLKADIDHVILLQKTNGKTELIS